jgi:hypothetical protein
VTPAARELVGLARAAGFGLADLANAPHHLYAAVAESVEKETKQRRAELLRSRYRQRR